MIKKYSLKRDGQKYISPHFQLWEFACHDGSDDVYVDTELTVLLEDLRSFFGGARTTVNSSYRTPAYNKKIGGSPNSQHCKGTAADIMIEGISPTEVAEAAEYFLKTTGGVGLYTYSKFTHVDTRLVKSRWYEKKDRSTAGRGSFSTLSVMRRLEAQKEMVEDSKVIVNGKEVKVKRILKDGTNYVKIRDIATALDMNISANGSIPILTTK